MPTATRPLRSLSGLEMEGELEWGIVYNPNLEERFTARRGVVRF
jgi:fructose-1,6-bisphosphatase/inositol monophosphatase family enzyme